ncbi:tyrosine-protein phosphatase [Paracoccus sp. Ld10]|uniref:tyrosine-protein phosphatase n=1 Tax=Paracoccus sp. Ld10 TaxID=649158 RepID=UPI00386EAFFA
MIVRLLKRVAVTLAIGLVIAGIAAVGWAGWLQHTGNLHAVVAGQVYRSAQPSGQRLSTWTTAYGFRSVLNLRGQSDATWYRQERREARRLNLHHVDFAMSDDQQMTPARAADLISLLHALPKPLLIHCKAGADRTGLAAALYLASLGHPEAEAEAQISFQYGHVSLPVSAAWPMNLSWEALEPSLGYDS